MSSWRVVVKETLAFYARHTRGLLAVSGLMLLPLAAVEMASALFRASSLFPHALRPGWTAVAGTFAVTLAGLMVVIVTDGMLTFYVARQLAGRPLGYQTSWARGLSRVRPVITAYLATVVPMLGFVLLALVPCCLIAMLGLGGWLLLGPPGWLFSVAIEVFVVVRLALVTPVAAIERLGGFEAYHTNLRLLAGRWRTVAAVLVPLQLARWLLGRGIARVLTPPWADAVDHLLVWLTLPLMATATTILYVSIRGETEGYDRSGLAADLES